MVSNFAPSLKGLLSLYNVVVVFQPNTPIYVCSVHRTARWEISRRVSILRGGSHRLHQLCDNVLAPIIPLQPPFAFGQTLFNPNYLRGGIGAELRDFHAASHSSTWICSLPYFFFFNVPRVAYTRIRIDAFESATILFTLFTFKPDYRVGVFGRDFFSSSCFSVRGVLFHSTTNTQVYCALSSCFEYLNRQRGKYA